MLRQQKSDDTQGNSIDVEKKHSGLLGRLGLRRERLPTLQDIPVFPVMRSGDRNSSAGTFGMSQLAKTGKRRESDQQKEPRMGGSSCGFGMMSPAHVYRRYLVCGHTLTIITDSPCPGRHRLGHSSPRLSGINVSPIGPLILSRSILPGRKRPPK